MNQQQIASRIGQLLDAIGNAKVAQAYYCENDDEGNADRIAEGLSEMYQELHELRLARGE